MPQGIQGSRRPRIEGNGTLTPTQPFEGSGYAYGQGDVYHRPSDWTRKGPYTGEAPFQQLRSGHSDPGEGQKDDSSGSAA